MRRWSGDRSAPGTLSTNAPAAESRAVTSVAAASATNAGSWTAVKTSLRGPMTMTPSAVTGTAAAVHRASRTDGRGSGRTGPAARAS